MHTAAADDRLAPLSLAELCDRLASEAPAPGGGPFAGLVTAMAAALVAKVARGSREGWDEAGGIAAQALALCQRATWLAAEDADAHVAALAALRAGDDDQTVAAALALAADLPLAIAGAAADTAVLAGRAARHGDPDRRPDAQAAAVLAAAAAQVAATLVEVNLGVLPGDPRVLAARERVRAAASAAAGE